MITYENEIRDAEASGYIALVVIVFFWLAAVLLPRL